MPADNKLELVVEVDVNKANASIKSLNTGLSSMEQAASKAAHGAAAGMDQMTASMVKGATAGNLIAESIKKALEWAKEWTLGAAEHAAHTDKMAMSMASLAKAHGVSAAASAKAVEAVKSVGFSTEAAIHAVDRLMISDMKLSKAQGLAKVAKDAAAIENISAPEALEKLLMAIESGASRGLRTMGIFVDLNKEVQRQELLTGKTLDEKEIQQLRYNAVMREAAKIQGAAAAASGSAEAQSKALAREVTELKEAIGEHFQDYLRSWVGHLRDLVGFLKENSDWLVKFAQGAMLAAGILATYGLATKILEIGSAVKGLTAALALNPWALLMTGVVASGAIIWNKWQTTKEGLDRGYEDVRRKALQRDLLSGKLKPGDVTKMGYTEDQLRDIVTGRKGLLPGESYGDYTGPKLAQQFRLPGDAGYKPGAKELSDEEIRRIAEIRKKQGEAEKTAAEYYLRAIEERKSAEHDQARARIEDSMKIIESTHSETAAVKESVNVLLFSMQEREAGLAKIRDEEQREIAARSTYVDEKSGAVRHFTLAASTLETIHKGTAEKLAAFDLKFNEEESRRIEAIWKAMAARLSDLRNQLVIEPMQQGLFISGQSFELDTKREDARLGYEKAAVQQRRDIALAQLEAVDADTLRDKLLLEQRKTGIEVDAIRQRTAIELQEIDRRTEADINAAERAMLAKGIFDDARQNEVRKRIRQLGEDEKQALKKGTASQIDIEQTRSATRARQLIEGQYTAIFQTLKEQAGGVFDALFTKSQSVWAAIGNSFKKTMLDVLRDVVTSRIAAMFTELLTGGEARAPKAGGKTLPGQLKELGGALAWLGIMGPGKQQPALADSLMPAPESDPVRVALLRNLEKRTRGQAEFDRIVAADSHGMVDAGTSLAAFVASMTPVGNLALKAASVLGNPSWGQVRSTLESFTPDQAMFPGGALTRMPRAAVAAPKFATVREAETFMRETLGVTRPTLGTDLGLAQKVVEGFAETVNRGGVLPPRIAIEGAGFPLKEVDAIAHYLPSRSAIEINPYSYHWTGDTAASQLHRFTERWSSSPDPNATLFHETGHYLHQANIRNSTDAVQQFVHQEDRWMTESWRQTAQTVSAYAAKSPKEFVAEVYAGKMSGRSYSRDVESLYRYLGGPELRLRRPASGGGDLGSRAPLNDLNPFGASSLPSESDPIRAAMLANMEKRTRGQAEFDRILAADSKGMVDAGTSMAVFAASMTPVGNLAIKAMSVLGAPSWGNIRSTLDSFSFAAAPVGVPKGLVQNIGKDAPVNPEQINFLFNKTAADMAAVGRKGGLARVRNAEMKKFLDAEERKLARELAADEAADDAAFAEYTTSQYRGPELRSAETTRQASSKLDAMFPWLAGAEKTQRSAAQTAARAVRPVREALGRPATRMTAAERAALELKIMEMRPDNPGWKGIQAMASSLGVADTTVYKIVRAREQAPLNDMGGGWVGPGDMGTEGGTGASLTNLPWRYPGTPPFLPSGGGGGAMVPSQSISTSGLWPGQTFGGWTMGKSGLTGSLKNLKSFFGFGDDKLVNLGGGRGASGGWIGQYGSFGDKLQALGKSDATMMGGAMLAFNGLQRGGWTGMGEDVAGGAMIGYKFGGPLGAAIGASIGLEAGIVRMFIKGPVEKTKEKVKALYGVDIRDKGVLNQIVQMAKSGFGGNIDMAIRSPQIRDLIQLYAMTTGQKISGMPGPVTPLSLVEKGGSLYQSPQYNNGTALSALGGLPSLNSIGGSSTSSASGTVVIPLQIDSTSIGNVVIQDGRVVAQGAITAMKSNAGRRELTALQLSPGTLVS